MNDLTYSMLQQSIDRFWETIPAMWGQVRNNIRTLAAEEFDVTFEQFHILRHIRQGKHSVSELAKVKHISRPAISQAVDLLVTRGLITRCQKTGDRRYVQLELTPSGAAVLDTVFCKNREWMSTKLSNLSGEEVHSLLVAMDVLNKSFTEGGI